MIEMDDQRKVLRYWLEVLRHESATTAGFAAHPEGMADGPFEPNLAWPASDLSHFELPLNEGGDALAQLLTRRRQTLLIEPLTAAHIGFFERWLARAVRRMRLRRGGAPWLEAEPDLFIGFPVVQRTDRRETLLMPLLELQVLPTWIDRDGGVWRPEDFGQLGHDDPPPVALELTLSDDAALVVPYLLNQATLQRAAGLEPHTVAELTAWLGERPGISPEEMILAVATTLRGGSVGNLPELPDGLSAGQMLDGLAGELSRAIRGRGDASLLPRVAVFEGGASVPTARVQEELVRLATPDESMPRFPECLDRVLSGERPPLVTAPHRALRYPRELTPAQTRAISACRASALVCVEGPPGTGKTELIVSLAAEHLVDCVVRGVYDSRGAEAGILVVTSTNNQAVDHALRPLESCGAVPVALRLGNRQVSATRTAMSLARVEGLLAAADASLAAGELDQALARFAATRSLVDALDAQDPDAWRRRTALFEAAILVRDAWARTQRDSILTLLRLDRRPRDMPMWQPTWLEEPEWRGLVCALFPIVGTTLLSLGSGFPLEPGVIEQLVVDEAGQCHAPYAASALFRARRALIIGDIHQLEPIVGLSPPEDDRLLARAGLDATDERTTPFRMAPPRTASVQTLTERAAAEIVPLRQHFRCQPDIIGISSRLVGYELEVRTPPRSLAVMCDLLVAPALMLPTHGAQRAWGRSQQNPDEAARVVELAARLVDDGIPAGEIGIVTPYQAQYHLLRRLLQRRGLPVGGGSLGGVGAGQEEFDAILLGTIHRLQGGERDVVLLSMVARSAQALRWIDERPNLLNVAVSRARVHLVVVGDPETLRCGRHTRHLVDSIPPEAWLTQDA
ncbi:MAG: AAA domain-containing protein [Myxococcota bacterium]